MKKFIALTRIIIKSGMGNSSMNNSSKKKRMPSKVAKTISIISTLIIAVPIFAMMMGLGTQISTVFSAMNNSGTAVELIAGMGSSMTLFFAFPFVLSVFFMSSDLEKLLPLPIKPETIVASKFTSVLLYQYLMIVAMYAPMMIGFGVTTHLSVSAWIMVVLSIILLPITPVVYASIVAIILLRCLSKMKNKESIVTAAGFVLSFAIVGVSFTFNGKAGADIVAMLSSDTLTSALRAVFPNITLLAKGVTDVNWLMMLLYVVSIVAIMAIFLLIAQKLYLGGVKGVREGGGKAKNLSASKYEKIMRKRSPVNSYVKKEIRSLVRSPEYFMNCLMMPIILPLIMVVSAGFGMAGSMDKEIGELVNNPEVQGALSGDVAVMPSGLIAVILLVVFFVLTTFICSANYTTVTAISREGKGYVNMKYIPMSYHDQIKAKLLCGSAVNAIMMAPYVLAISIVAIIIFNASIFAILCGIVIAVLTAMMINYVQMFIDICFPKLVWETEQGAIKQNMNTAFSMFGFWIFAGIVGFAGYGLFKVITNTYLFCAVMIIIALLVCLVARTVVYKIGVKKLNEL